MLWASLRCGRLNGLVRVAVSAVGNHSKIMRLPVRTGLVVAQTSCKVTFDSFSIRNGSVFKHTL